MGTYIIDIVVVSTIAAGAAVIAVLVRRRAPFDDAADLMPLGMSFTIVAGLHGVLAMFVLIGLFDAATTTRQAADREADSLVAAAWAADTMPEPARHRLREQARDYATTVINREWPLLQAGDPVDQTGWQLLQDLRRTIAEAPAATGAAQDRQAEASDLVVDTYQARQTRLTVGTQRVPALLWFVLSVSTGAVLGLAYLFGGRKVAGYVTMVAVMAGVLAMLLLAIFHLQVPLGGSAGVGAGAFQSALDRLS